MRLALGLPFEEKVGTLEEEAKKNEELLKKLIELYNKTKGA